MKRRYFLSMVAAVAGTALVSAPASAEETIHITVKTLTGKSIQIDINSSASVLDIKKAILNKEGIPTDIQRLIFSGQLLDNAKTLGAYSIAEGSTLHLVLKLS